MTGTRKYRYGGSIGVEVAGEIRESYTQVTVATIKAKEKGGKVVFMTREEELSLAKKDLDQPRTWYDTPGRVYALQKAIERLSRT